eukprot:3282828-Alexandrium_andersonii.AAC.1
MLRKVWLLTDAQITELAEYFACEEPVTAPVTTPDNLVRATALANASSNSFQAATPECKTPVKASQPEPATTPAKTSPDFKK